MTCGKAHLFPPQRNPSHGSSLSGSPPLSPLPHRPRREIGCRFDADDVVGLVSADPSADVLSLALIHHGLMTATGAATRFPNYNEHSALRLLVLFNIDTASLIIG
jgi:hypothetical protein